MQKAGGVTDEAVYRSVRDPKEVLVMHRFATMDQARSFLESSELREAMGKAGFDTSSVRVEFYEED
jgi:heme-degrading monooxygenase HmoA